ncbi:hypothetical protein D3C71_1814430 [compost metagenome]
MRREVVALVAQHTHQLGGQCIIEQSHDGITVGAKRRGDSAVIQVRGGGVQGLHVQLHAVFTGW